MIVNYFVTALRSFKQHKQHFALNLIGLSIGLAAAILVALFAQNELSYDSQQPDAERVFRIQQDLTAIGIEVLPFSNYVKAAATSKNYSQVEDIFALTSVESSEKVITAVNYQGQGYKLGAMLGATPNIERFIDMKTLAGDLKNALSTPDSLALNESEAVRIFGSTDIIGKALHHVKGQYIVRAVFADLPENTHFAFKNLVYVKHDQAAINNNSYVYVKLAEQSDPNDYAKVLTEQAITDRFKGKSSLGLMPLLDIHLAAKSMAEFKRGGEKQDVMICIGLSALLVLIASFNFINISVAQSTKRAKEVGVRKALGASKAQLVIQFLSESVLISLLATIIACTLVEVSLPSFNTLIDRELVVDYTSRFGLVIVVVSILVGIFAGLYPAFFISSFSAKRVLSGDLQHGNTATIVRKFLLVLQAAISIALIITTITMSQQLTHLQNLPLGYETKQRLVISALPTELVYAKDTTSLLDKLNDIKGVGQLTVLGSQITKSTINIIKATWPNGEKAEGFIPVTGAGFNIVDGLGLTLLAGRDFSPEFASDWDAVVPEPFNRDIGAIITESIAKQAGFNNVADIIGKTITSSNPQYPANIRVVGVVANVIVGNGQQGAKLMFLCGYPIGGDTEVIMTIDTQNVFYIQQQIVELLAEHANIFDPKINLLADNYKAVFRGDERVSKVVSIFASLVIFLTMLGTFGLASFATLRRQKEVAMRKVLGASRLSIVNLLTKEFLILVVIGIFIAFPLTHWLVGDWLANFNERIEQAPWIYIISALCIAMLTWLTVASLAFKVASTRPSLILRDE
ncbi:ABC transporter permease [Colwellia sp. BRX10-4]|jgi:putative ABC transport system permease protein|uniref:ABC transporter permease n=1 Tax=Colwellia sp. BRX10-4 TaxID=2759843 RepID=UPI0015F45872|nr:ABC transporter permease [Colwellia sp. BRX10-4]MBA6398923.1 ABC transporter permease [Colwellia sp. BRX10-4]